LDFVSHVVDDAFTVTDPVGVRAEREAERAARRAERLRRAADRAAAWENSAPRQVVVDRSGPTAILRLQPTRYDVDEGIEGASDHWRAITLVTIADRSRLVSVSTCIEQVSAYLAISDPEAFERALRGWLTIVSTSGYLTPLPHDQYCVTERWAVLDRQPPVFDLPSPPRPERPPR